MIDKLFNWLKSRFSDETPEAPQPHVRTSMRAQRAIESAPQGESDEFEDMSGEIESLGPGKNVLIRNKYVREDTGTHETLKILDDSLVDSGEETGIDPYNTGGFDRSRNWDTRFRK